MTSLSAITSGWHLGRLASLLGQMNFVVLHPCYLVVVAGCMFYSGLVVANLLIPHGGATTRRHRSSNLPIYLCL